MSKPVLIMMMLSLVLLLGCGGGGDKEAAGNTPGDQVETGEAGTGGTDAGQAGEAALPQTTGGRAIKDAREVTARHDCDGGCGLTNLPLSQLTEIDGKYYCPVCVEKARQKAD